MQQKNAEKFFVSDIIASEFVVKLSLLRAGYILLAAFLSAAQQSQDFSCQ